MLTPDEYADVLVMVAHPSGDLVVPLERWIQTGPGPRRYVGIIGAVRVSTNEELPIIEIPLAYHNSPESRQLQREGRLPTPWGPPPEDDLDLDS